MEKTKYNTIHRWLNRHFEKFSCENDTCEKKPGRIEFAVIHGKRHAKKRENYRQLCFYCHLIYDKGTRNSGRRKKGFKISDETKRKMSLAQLGKHGGPRSEIWKKHLSEAIQTYWDKIPKSKRSRAKRSSKHD